MDVYVSTLTLWYDLIPWAFPEDVQLPLLPSWLAEDVAAWHLSEPCPSQLTP